MTRTASTQYYPTLTAATAREHVADLHRAAEASRVLAACRAAGDTGHPAAVPRGGCRS